MNTKTSVRPTLGTCRDPHARRTSAADQRSFLSRPFLGFQGSAVSADARASLLYVSPSLSLSISLSCSLSLPPSLFLSPALSTLSLFSLPLSLLLSLSFCLSRYLCVLLISPPSAFPPSPRRAHRAATAPPRRCSVSAVAPFSPLPWPRPTPRPGPRQTRRGRSGGWCGPSWGSRSRSSGSARGSATPKPTLIHANMRVCVGGACFVRKGLVNTHTRSYPHGVHVQAHGYTHVRGQSHLRS